MARYTVTYTLEGAMDFEADTEEQAREMFEESDESEKAGNTFCSGWQINDVYYRGE